MKRKALTLGNYRHTLTVIRSLANAGFDVIVGRDEARTFTQFSRYASEIWDHPKFEEQDAFILALALLLNARSDIQLVFPIGESVLKCIAQNLDRIPAHARIIMPDPVTLLTCLDKARMYEIVSALHIPLPESRVARNFSELVVEAKSVGFPCIIKPNCSLNYFFNKKAIFCGSMDDIEKYFVLWPGGNEFLILQRYIEGYRPNCHFAAMHGRVLVYFEHDVIRTDRVDMTGLEVDGVSVPPTPILRKYCETLVQHLDYTGVGCIQFIADRQASSFYFLEINPRLDATCVLPYHCGLDFPRMAVDLTGGSGECLPSWIESSIDYPVGRRVHWLLGDLRGLVHGLEDRTVNFYAVIRWLRQMLNALKMSDFHLTFSWRDPLPTGFLYWRMIVSGWNRVRSRVRARFAESSHRDTNQGAH